MNRNDQAGKAGTGRPMRGGFTLIEILAALGVLSILVMLIGRLFGDASSAMTTGTRVAEVNANARAVLEFMARDVQTAMFDDPSTAGDPPYLLLRTAATRPDVLPSHYLGQNSGGARELAFVAPVNVPRSTHRRETKIVLYRTRNQRIGGDFLDHRYELMRAEYYDGTSGGPMARYNDPIWAGDPTSGVYRTVWEGADVMIQNVRSVRFQYLRQYEGTGSPAAVNARTDQAANRIAFLDIHLELLSPQDAIRAAQLFSAAGGNILPNQQFVERNVRRYHQRVFFYNAHGYYHPNR